MAETWPTYVTCSGCVPHWSLTVQPFLITSVPLIPTFNFSAIQSSVLSHIGLRLWHFLLSFLFFEMCHVCDSKCITCIRMYSMYYIHEWMGTFTICKKRAWGIYHVLHITVCVSTDRTCCPFPAHLSFILKYHVPGVHRVPWQKTSTSDLKITCQPTPASVNVQLMR